MKTKDYSIDDINKAIRNNLFNRINNLSLVPIDNSFNPSIDAHETVLVPAVQSRPVKQSHEIEIIWSR